MIQLALDQAKFDRIVRFTNSASLSNVKLLGEFCRMSMERLGLKSQPKKAVRGLPAGSDQHDVRSIGEWMERISPTANAEDFEQASEQLIAIDATIKARLGD